MNFSEIISKTKLQVRRECQFFGALMLFASIKESTKLDTAATDGRDIFFNKKFLESLTSSEQNALMLHEVLHMALLHVQRRQTRDPYIWNIASDIVVNDLIKRNTSFKLPKGAIVDDAYRDKSVEYIYEALLKDNKYKGKKYKLSISDIQLTNEEQEKNGIGNGHGLTEEEQEEVASYWKDKMQVLKNSDSLIQNDKYGSHSTGGWPAGMAREVENILEPEINWRNALWKYIGRTPADFDDLDRRFLYRGLYLEGLMTDAIEVSVCIDTSGSVSKRLIDQFVAETKGILRSYPHVKCDFFYSDCKLSGPYDINQAEQIPILHGGGGTSFIPFFKYLEKNNSNNFGTHKLSIYLTDGYEAFPNWIPSNPVMWLVSKDGEETKNFPFGEVIRISTESI
jgi:predicted metal-dependent peptidase